jgi:acetyltransferase-like isoleucine patch superfamily enzyme
MSATTQSLKSYLKRLYGCWLRHAPGSSTAISGENHRVIWNDARLHHCQVSVSGKNNRLEFGQGAMLWGAKIQLTGDNLVCHIGARTRLRGGTFIVTDQGSRLEVGDSTTMTGPVIVAQGGKAVILGEDCMVAYGSDIRCSDGHSVIDIATGENLNPAADVIIGNHVWIGIHSQILKGLTIADHAIVAARSVVTRPVMGGTIVAGNPARSIRTGVTWDRRRPVSVDPQPTLLRS